MKKTQSTFSAMLVGAAFAFALTNHFGWCRDKCETEPAWVDVKKRSCFDTGGKAMVFYDQSGPYDVGCDYTTD
jgi:hypothetical protein